MNKIIYGLIEFTDADIVNGNCFVSHSMTGESLAADTLDFRVWSADEDHTQFTPGSTVGYKRDGLMVGQFYLRGVKRAGKHIYDFSCISAIGVLGDTMHYGGIYTGQTVAEVAAEILEGLPYEIDPIVGDIKLYGWLPIDTKRNNLQQITIATAIAVRTKPDGTLLLTALSNDVKGTIGANRMAIGGNVAVDTPYSAVQVSEHYYQEIAEEIVLFSKSSVKTESLEFNEPVHDLTVTGGTLIESGANYAIVECNGFAEVKAKRYLHTTKTVTIGTVEGLPSDKIYSVNNATLITSLNSSGVAQKLYEAYTKPATIQSNIFFGNEKAGDVVGVINPHTKETESAFLKKQDINISNLLLANSDFVVDFTPSGAVTGYKNRVLITEDGNWAVPAGVNEVRAVLIGGGTGGSGGATGETGGNGRRFPSSAHGYSLSEVSNGTGGAGGLFGAGGAGGLVLDTGAMTVTPGQNLAIAIGAGGTGGATGTAGSDGGNTTLDALSSAVGERLDRGYTDILSSNVYGIPGLVGRSGKDGRGDTNYMESIRAYYDGYTTGDEYCRLHGLLGDHDSDAVYESGVWKTIYAIGGSGGGAAWATSLDDGWEATCGLDGYASKLGFTSAVGGNGGTGRIPQVGLNATVYGGGGHGGNGGGGGGGGGACINGIGGASHETFGAGGIGGTGSAGGDGKAGCVIIYF